MASWRFLLWMDDMWKSRWWLGSDKQLTLERVMLGKCACIICFFGWNTIFQELCVPTASGDYHLFKVIIQKLLFIIWFIEKRAPIILSMGETQRVV